jgi:peptidoglycan/LPS O-acetylase OafA/YrhL
MAIEKSLGIRTGIKINSISSLRGLAAIWVCIHHANYTWIHSKFYAYISIPGYVSVAFFFVLSGYVLTIRYDTSLTVRDFYKRRFARIWPSAFLAFSSTLVIYSIFRQSGAGFVSLVGALLNPFLLQGWIPLHPEIRQSWNGVAWTLSCEFFFYLLFPVITKTLNRSSSLLRLGILVFCTYSIPVIIAASMDWKIFSDLVWYWPPFAVLLFLLGIILRLEQQKSHQIHFSFSGKYLAGFFFVSWLISVKFLSRATSSPALLATVYLPFFVCMIWSVASGRRFRLLEFSPLVKIGECSYSIYIWHAIILGFFGKFLAPLVVRSSIEGDAFTIIYVCVTIWLGVIAYKFIEKPMNLLVLRMLDRTKKL